MNSNSTRSEQVVEDYKKRKVAASALRRIHDIIHGFEREQAQDRRLARLGILAIVLILIVAAVLYFNFDSVRLS